VSYDSHRFSSQHSRPSPPQEPGVHLKTHWQGGPSRLLWGWQWRALSLESWKKRLGGWNPALHNDYRAIRECRRSGKRGEAGLGLSALIPILFLPLRKRENTKWKIFNLVSPDCTRSLFLSPLFLPLFVFCVPHPTQCLT
jgi:hypothetical protein